MTLQQNVAVDVRIDTLLAERLKGWQLQSPSFPQVAG
jgi:hypothetical protein